jgi:hypothetical protein
MHASGCRDIDSDRSKFSLGHQCVRNSVCPVLYSPRLLHPRGFLYLPTFAVLFYPLTMLGLRFCNLVWRSIMLICLFKALARAVSRVNAKHDRFTIMGTTLLFAIFGAAGAVTNGQTTTLLLAATFLAFDAAYDRRLARAAFWPPFTRPSPRFVAASALPPCRGTRGSARESPKRGR